MYTSLVLTPSCITNATSTNQAEAQPVQHIAVKEVLQPDDTVQPQPLLCSHLRMVRAGVVHMLLKCASVTWLRQKVELP